MPKPSSRCNREPGPEAQVHLPLDDPPPQPPAAPDPSACCQSGCIPCVYDLYDEAMDRYRQQLRAWQSRHPNS